VSTQSHKEIRRGHWFKFKLDEGIESNFPNGLNFSGTYIIFDGRNCLYVGQSKNIKSRLKNHIQLARYSHKWKTPWGNYFRLTIGVRKERFGFERLAIEKRLIEKFNPFFNQLLKVRNT